jgi:hypothetical protein
MEISIRATCHGMVCETIVLSENHLLSTFHGMRKNGYQIHIHFDSQTRTRQFHQESGHQNQFGPLVGEPEKEQIVDLLGIADVTSPLWF